LILYQVEGATYFFNRVVGTMEGVEKGKEVSLQRSVIFQFERKGNNIPTNFEARGGNGHSFVTKCGHSPFICTSLNVLNEIHLQSKVSGFSLERVVILNRFCDIGI